MRRSDRYRIVVVLAMLVALHFSVRTRLGDDRITPDFLLVALLLYTIRAQPGASAGAGFVVGVLRDALAPASFGAGAVAHTVVGYLSAWGKAVFFAENLFVSGCVFFASTWLRNLVLTLASGKLAGAQLWWVVLYYSPAQSFTTALVGVGVLWLFGRWMAVRRVEA